MDDINCEKKDIKMNNVYVLILNYDIRFNDSDEGSSYAGEGSKIINIYAKEKDALGLAEAINPMLSSAKDTKISTSFIGIIKEKIDHMIDNIDNTYEASEFVLVVKPFAVCDIVH